MKKIWLLFIFIMTGSIYCQEIEIPEFTKSSTHWKDIRADEAIKGANIPDCGLIKGIDYRDYGANQPLSIEMYCNGINGNRKLQSDILYGFEVRTDERTGDDLTSPIDFVKEFRLTWSCNTQNHAGVQKLTDLHDQIVKLYNMESKKYKDKDLIGKRSFTSTKKILFVENKKLGKTFLIYDGLVDGVIIPNYMKNGVYNKKCADVQNLDKKM